ncbi:hypothetical protein [Methylobacterium sp. 17Sr1-1]|uniref:hypothetical protein n=1 Tax=Methylobacterium sp. 17Sr1-1 TaxID=2202826 RepID=UPI0013A58149|nr:hypothetical protein [Methylobacterium sp. 17Sr1-1]
MTRQPSEAISYEQAEFMALLSDLVRTVAAVEGMDEVSVGIYARAAREAGFISQGGRGRSAAKMSVIDAVNLIIAVNGCALAKDVPNSIPIYRNLRVSECDNPGVSPLGGARAAFGDDLERVISLWATRDKNRLFDYSSAGIGITFHKPYFHAEIRLFVYLDGDFHTVNTYYRGVGDNPLDYDGDRSDDTIITDRTIDAITKLISL